MAMSKRQYWQYSLAPLSVKLDVQQVSSFLFSSLPFFCHLFSSSFFWKILEILGKSEGNWDVLVKMYQNLLEIVFFVAEIIDCFDYRLLRLVSKPIERFTISFKTDRSIPD